MNTRQTDTKREKTDTVTHTKREIETESHKTTQRERQIDILRGTGRGRSNRQ